jgi:predicted amidohydrolase
MAARVGSSIGSVIEQYAVAAQSNLVRSVSAPLNRVVAISKQTTKRASTLRLLPEVFSEGFPTDQRGRISGLAPLDNG